MALKQTDETREIKKAVKDFIIYQLDKKNISSECIAACAELIKATFGS